MMTIEELRGSYVAIPFAQGRYWSLHTVVPQRVHLSRGELGEFAIFLVGERESFGAIPKTRGVLHTSELTALPDGHNVSALHLKSTDSYHGDRVMAHIAYELLRVLTANPTADNRELLNQIRWTLPLLGVGAETLPTERQRGLIGECILLRELLLLGRVSGFHPSIVLSRWWGHSAAMRDFAAVSVAIEVKTTAMNTRLHQIGSLAQLEPQGSGEEVFIYSIGLKPDPSSNRRLPVYIEEVEQLLVADNGEPVEVAVKLFHEQLSAYGYDRASAGLYDATPGYLPNFDLPASLYPEATLDRLRQESFVNQRLPSMVAAVSYALNITSEPLNKAQTIGVFQKLLASAPIAEQ